MNKKIEQIQEEINKLGITEVPKSGADDIYRYVETLGQNPVVESNYQKEIEAFNKTTQTISELNKEVRELNANCQEIEAESEIEVPKDLVARLELLGLTFNIELGKEYAVHDQNDRCTDYYQPYSVYIYQDGVLVDTIKSEALNRTVQTDVQKLSIGRLSRDLSTAKDHLRHIDALKKSDTERQKSIERSRKALVRLYKAKDKLVGADPKVKNLIDDSKIGKKLTSALDAQIQRHTENIRYGQAISRYPGQLDLALDYLQKLEKTEKKYSKRLYENNARIYELTERKLPSLVSDLVKTAKEMSVPYYKEMGVRLLKIYKENYDVLKEAKTLGAKGAFIKLIPEGGVREYVDKHFDKLYIIESVATAVKQHLMISDSANVPYSKMVELAETLVGLVEKGYTQDKVGVLGENLRKAYNSFIGKDLAKEFGFNMEYSKLSDENKDILKELYKAAKEQVIETKKVKEEGKAII